MKRRRISETEWSELRVAHAAGCGLRELARNAGIAEGTVLAMAHRQRWTQRNHDAKALATVPQSNAISVADSAALTMAARGERHVERMADVAERVVPHVEAMQPGEIFERIEKVDRLDRLARRQFGLDDRERGGTSCVNLSFLGFAFNSHPVVPIEPGT